MQGQVIIAKGIVPRLYNLPQKHSSLVDDSIAGEDSQFSANFNNGLSTRRQHETTES